MAFTEEQQQIVDRLDPLLRGLRESGRLQGRAELAMEILELTRSEEFSKEKLDEFLIGIMLEAITTALSGLGR